MGKGTDTLQELTEQQLSATELAERNAALTVGSDAEATLEGTIVERRTPTKPARQVVQAPQQTWD